jgi:hypothetical protein
MDKNKKGIAITLLFFIFLGLFSPLAIASAEDIDAVGLGFSALRFSMFANFFPALGAALGMLDIAGALGKPVANGIIGAAAGWVAGVATLFLNLSRDLLNWVISDGFINVSMTGSDNVFVTYGWNMIRNLANIILVLGVVVIGLGMILGIEEYKAKKTLPTLIAIAILINFTPVICGFIIDFCNILMHYFLTGGISSGIASAVEEGISRIPTDNAMNALGIASVYFVFSIVASITLALYAFLFAARFLFIWVLVMFSPIAFVSRIFPKSSWIEHFFPSFFYWGKWWDQFIRWCVMGIYGGFFVFLANQLMTGQVSSAPSGGLSVFGSLFGYVLPIIVLLIGLKSVKSTLEQEVPGAKEALGLAKTAGMAAITGGAGLAAGLAAGGATGLYAGATAQTGRGLIAEAIGGAKGAARGALTSGGRAKGVRDVKRLIERVPLANRLVGGPGAADAEFEAKKNAQKKRIAAIPNTPEGNRQAAALAENWELTEEDFSNRMALVESLGERNIPIRKELLPKYLKEYQNYGGKIEDVIKGNPKFSKYFTNDQGNNMTIQEGLDKILPKDLSRNIQMSAIQITPTTDPGDRADIEETVLAIASDKQKFEAMKNLPRNKKLAFVASLHAIVSARQAAGITLPPEVITNEARTLKDPKWK